MSTESATGRGPQSRLCTRLPSQIFWIKTNRKAVVNPNSIMLFNASSAEAGQLIGDDVQARRQFAAPLLFVFSVDRQRVLARDREHALDDGAAVTQPDRGRKLLHQAT
jgi:hypothetical protein